MIFAPKFKFFLDQNLDFVLGFDRARIYTITRLTKGTIFGFSLSIVNPHIYQETQRENWRIWTYDKFGSAVDGSTSTVAWNPRDNYGSLGVYSWGIYKYQLTSEQFTVTVNDLRPSSGSADNLADTSLLTENTLIEVYFKVPENGMYNFRITSPDGYRWWFKKEEFVFRKAAPELAEGQYVERATADLPLMSIPIPPSEPVNQLRLDVKSPLYSTEQYGFKAKVTIPKLSPTASANFFTIEFGFDGTDIGPRLAGGVAPAEPVRALINARVDYRTNIFSPNPGPEIVFNNMLSFEINIVTPIERAGGLVIIGPLSYIFAHICLPKPVAPYAEFPYDSTCEYTLTSDGQLRPQITITAGQSGIPANMYKFSLDVENPRVPTKDGADPGLWEFHSFVVVSKVVEFNDVMATFASFPVTSPMVHGELIQPSSLNPTCNFPDKLEDVSFPQMPNCPIFDWQYSRIGRDDRPTAVSALIFRFQVAKTIPVGVGIQSMILKGPAGVSFPLECQVTTAPVSVFDALRPDLWYNSINTLYQVNGLRAWPQQAEVVDCVGKDNIATIRFTEGLGNDFNFAFRIVVQANPISDPDWNYWTIEYSNEATQPFPGFSVWTFSDSKITTTDTSISLRGVTTRSVVTIKLRSTNDLNRVSTLGKLFVRAPSGFILNNQFCLDVQVSDREQPDMDHPELTPSDLTEMAKWSTWAHGRDSANPSFLCQSEVNPSNIGSIRPSVNNYFKGGILYVFTILVDNPLTVEQASYWTFISRADTADISSVLDSSSVIGFPVNYLARSFILEDPPTRNGLSKLTLTFRFSFNDRVEPVNIISIKAPIGFSLNEPGSSECRGYNIRDGKLKRTPPVCLANIITWTLMEDFIPAHDEIVFSLDTTNPPVTPSPKLQVNLFKLAQTTQDRSVLKKNLANKFFGYLARCDILEKFLYIDPKN